MIKIGPPDISGLKRGLEQGVARAKHDALKLGALLGKQAVQGNFDRAQDETGAAWKSVARGGKPLQNTGKMKKGIAAGEPQGNVVYIGAGEATKAYNRIHNEGGTTRAHVIRPRRKKALAFPWKGGTGVFKYVNHPGSKIPRRHFMYIRDQDREKINRAMRDLFVKRINAK